MTESIRPFPILSEYDRKNRKEIPRIFILWDLIQPHEPQALLNHVQTLECLAQRGGLSSMEAVLVMRSQKWTQLDKLSAEDRKAYDDYDPQYWREKLVEIVKERLPSRTT